MAGLIQTKERGNALIYVLIAIVLFAALSMTLGRQTDTGEAGTLSEEKAALYATQMIAYAAQVKSGVDQMLFSGTEVSDLDFTLPNSAGYDAGTRLDKIERVYHPEGGGLIAAALSPEAIAYTGSDPAAGWYLGRFNTIEWTKTGAEDVVLAAYGIDRAVCENINRKATGTAVIPSIAASIRNILIDDVYHTGTNVAFTTDPAGTPLCADCHKISALCVEGTGGIYGFYSVIVGR